MNNTNFDSVNAPPNRHGEFKERDFDLRETRVLSMM